MMKKSDNLNINKNIIVLAVMLVVAVFAFCAPQVQAAGTNSDMIDQVIALVNQERAKEGLAPLQRYDALGAAAQVRAEEIVEVQSHTRPNGQRGLKICDEYGIDYDCAGENIAAGQTSAKEVVDDWMASPSHRENIMDPAFGHIGIGLVIDSNGEYEYYWTQLFTD
ncbi:MAG: hypothetical protein IJ600_02260 [Lachnospiraceae bacterium]|nr:hypothetical protein [Lachnospiraceae bacterium]